MMDAAISSTTLTSAAITAGSGTVGAADIVIGEAYADRLLGARARSASATVISSDVGPGRGVAAPGIGEHR